MLFIRQLRHQPFKILPRRISQQFYPQSSHQSLATNVGINPKLKTYYQHLGINAGASSYEIQEAYKRICSSGGIPSEFNTFSEFLASFKEQYQAYLVLMDPEARKQYDTNCQKLTTK